MMCMKVAFVWNLALHCLSGRAQPLLRLLRPWQPGLALNSTFRPSSLGFIGFCFSATCPLTSPCIGSAGLVCLTHSRN